MAAMAAGMATPAARRSSLSVRRLLGTGWVGSHGGLEEHHGLCGGLSLLRRSIGIQAVTIGTDMATRMGPGTTAHGAGSRSCAWHDSDLVEGGELARAEWRSRTMGQAGHPDPDPFIQVGGDGDEKRGVRPLMGRMWRLCAGMGNTTRASGVTGTRNVFRIGAGNLALTRGIFSSRGRCEMRRDPSESVCDRESGSVYPDPGFGQQRRRDRGVVEDAFPAHVASSTVGAASMPAHVASELPLDPVVKIFTVSSSPNYFMPWQNKPQRETSGSGFVIKGGRIVTNAHVVADQTYVLVRKHGCSTRFKAEVEAVGHECDLALLRVHNDEFWDGMYHLELGDIPHLQEAVAVVGYPQGGDNISVTGGVVSRVEPTQYSHGAASLMAIQIDAAINPGNSGGPAIMDDKVVGVAFQNLLGAENIGYIIPVPIIKQFLMDVEQRGRYVGFCALGLTCQAMENAQLRQHMGMKPGMTGVLVNKIHPLTDVSRKIRKDDVIMAFDGVSISNDGTVPLRKKERISFDYLVSLKKAGEVGHLTILRKGVEMDVDVILGPLRSLVPIHQYDVPPSYYIFAGLVFVPLTQPYLQEYGDDWYNASPRRLCNHALSTLPKRHGEQIVVLSQVLMDDVNTGYQNLSELQVKKVNGTAVFNLRHLQQLIEGSTDEHLRLDLDDDRVVVLDFAAAREASLDILQRHRIPIHVSEDLKEVDKVGAKLGDASAAGVEIYSWERADAGGVEEDEPEKDGKREVDEKKEMAEEEEERGFVVDGIGKRAHQELGSVAVRGGGWAIHQRDEIQRVDGSAHCFP